ncbi:hypothetical protein EDB81DRAFT_678820 [Dactylonectria macrodidyma]|uniref:Zn(2)-C6 fungal-type domain-containing protein n=1 Tax=Dactylonectria macrodidyma TaxID=307937 RepID=A0A9P9FMK3_9HYPO|nr:hypothetical protein EDB81DRAFT_678820 [Dactylonectria macrodidyma]
MKRFVGPLDKRRRISRCQPCAKRRIKCEGGSPCQHCVRTNKTCEPQSPVPHEIQFVAEQSPRHPSDTRISVQIHAVRDAVYLDHFVTFIQRCQFTAGFASATIDMLRCMNTSQPLHNLTMAIGALEASRRSSVRSDPLHDSPQFIAFGFYGRSIQALNHRLETRDALHRDDVLWSTFLIGLFELMTEASGEQWATHMVHGTSMIFQMTGPTKRPSALREQLFLAFRVLETHRAILYGEQTFLSRDVWTQYQESMASKPPEPGGLVLELMIRISSFAKRFFDSIEAIPDSLRSMHPKMDALANEGVTLLQHLKAWHDNTIVDSDDQNAYLNLALANYHALVLFHCRNFAFYPGWNEDSNLRLTRAEIDQHVDVIILLAGPILELSTIPGVLLLFPLRMAGANTTSADGKKRIRAILSRIYQKGFVVSDRIKVDLERCWEYQSRHECQVQLPDIVI